MPRPDVRLVGDTAVAELDAAAHDLLSEGAMNVAAAVRFAGVSRSTIYDAMADGSLPFVKRRGTNRLIPRKALVLWLAEGMKVDAPARRSPRG